MEEALRGLPGYPGDPPLVVETLARTGESAYGLQQLSLTTHTGTHVDAPLHFLPDGRDIATMPIDQWIGEAAVVDLSHLGENGEVSAAELEKHAGHVRAGDIVLLRTDWPRKMSVEKEEFWTRGPFTSTSDSHMSVWEKTG